MAGKETENKENIDQLRKSFKVSERVFEWVKARQEEVRKRTKKQPTQSDVVQSLIDKVSYAKDAEVPSVPGENVTTLNLPKSEGRRKIESASSADIEEQVVLLRGILGGTHQVAKDAITKNLEAFYELTRRARGEVVDVLSEGASGLAGRPRKKVRGTAR